MASCRLISSFTITASSNDDLVVTLNAVDETLTMAPGTYYMDDNGGGSDGVAAIVTMLNTHAQPGTFVAGIIGVTETDVGKADGRIAYGNDTNDFSFKFSAGASNIDPRIFGYNANETTVTSATQLLSSTEIHRYGWYPQREIEMLSIRNRVRSHISHTTGRNPDGVIWEEYNIAECEVAFVRGPLVRVAATNDSTAVTSSGLNLTVGDTNAAFERFVADLASDVSQDYRIYIDETDTATYEGPYQFEEDSPIWRDPLAQSTLIQRAGELWKITLIGMDVP